MMPGGAFDRQLGLWLPVAERRWAAGSGAGRLQENRFACQHPPKSMAPSRFDFFHFVFKDYIRALQEVLAVFCNS